MFLSFICLLHQTGILSHVQKLKNLKQCNESTMHKHNGLLGFVSAWEDISTAKKKRVWQGGLGVIC